MPRPSVPTVGTALDRLLCIARDHIRALQVGTEHDSVHSARRAVASERRDLTPSTATGRLRHSQFGSVSHVRWGSRWYYTRALCWRRSTLCLPSPSPRLTSSAPPSSSLISPVDVVCSCAPSFRNSTFVSPPETHHVVLGLDTHQVCALPTPSDWVLPISCRHADSRVHATLRTRRSSEELHGLGQPGHRPVRRSNAQAEDHVFSLPIHSSFPRA